MPTLACPCDDRLRGLLDASLCDRDAAGLLAHLDTCACCRRRLDALAGSPGTWQGLAKNLRPKEGEESPALAAVLADLRREPDSAADPVPTVLPVRIGRYQVERLIGRGGMGRVYRAFDPGLRRVVALKLLTESLAADPSARNRFLREARAVASITHDHVVTIHEVDQDAGQPYIVMQYVEGESLQARVDRLGPLRLREVLCIGMQVAAGLAAAHAQGIVHRDVKPGNILLEKGLDRARISDFGLARIADDGCATATGDLMGTPQYMSPEQARGESVDYRSDLFSLGAVLYTMCTGERPFRGGPPLSVLKRVCDEEPRPVRRTNPEVPDWLEAIIVKLMAKAPQDRFQSAAEVAELLGGHLAHLQQPDAVPQPARVERPSSPGPAHGIVEALARGAFGIVASIVLSLLLLTLMASHDGDRSWPVVLVALGFVGLVPALWGWRSAKRDSLSARRRRWLLLLCLLAVGTGIALLALGQPHGRTARHLARYTWPVGLLVFVAAVSALLDWAFRRSGRRSWLWVGLGLGVLVLIFLFLGCLGLSVKPAPWPGPVGQGGILLAGDPGLEVTVEGPGKKVIELRPMAPTFLPPGQYKVTAARDGEVLYQDEVHVLAGQYSAVNIFGTGWVRFLPSDVSVQLDGKQMVPRHGMNVRVGRHKWVARKDGKVVGQGEFLLRPDERKLIPTITPPRPAAKDRGGKQPPGKKGP